MKEIYGFMPVTLGCDPEVFITRIAGRVRKRIAAVGSERIIPPDGLRLVVGGKDAAVVTRDGVQAELHAHCGGCRQALARRINESVTLLTDAVAQARSTLRDPSLTVTFKPMITLTRSDISRLSPDARQLNCKPSLNAYGREPIERDGSTYPIRTASGHIHLGTQLFKTVDPDDGVKVLDLLVGIPCVLVDQDPSQRIRRETYGRAGEYRLPTHGLEYRVPGNFWLLDYKLQSMVFGLAKLAMAVCEGFNSRQLRADLRWAKETLLHNVDFDAVEKAINNNDFDLALRIYKESIRPFADQIIGTWGFGSGLMDPFEYFVDRIREKGLKHWFDVKDKAVLSRWTDSFSTSQGWEKFMLQVVDPQRRTAMFKGLFLRSAAKRDKDRDREVLPRAA